MGRLANMTSEERLYAKAARQIDRLQRLNKEQALGKLRTMSPELFEYLTALLFERQGYAATVTPASSDQGVDVWATKGRWTVIAQCKRYAHNVGQPVVRDLFATMLHNRADEAYLVTTAQVSRQAREWAADKPIHLIDGFALVDWIMSSRAASRTIFGAVRVPFVLLGALMGLAAIILALAVVLIFPQVSRRLRIGGNPTTAWVPPTVTQGQAINTHAAEVPSPAATEAVAVQPTAGSEPSPPATATPEPPPSPTPAPEPTAVDTCAADVAPDLADLYEPSLLGCATGDMSIVWSAWQPFERGFMLWRSDTDAAYGFTGSSEGLWLELSDRWDGSTPASRGDPPAGLQAPIRGFGYVWSRNDDLFHDLGWAIDQEKGFCASLQSFEQGFLLRSSMVPSCTPEGHFNHACTPDFTPISLMAHADGWSGDDQPGSGPSDVALEPATTPPSPGPTSTPPPATPSLPHSRPKSQGMFFAGADESIVLDGRFDEWPNQWTPIAAVVHGHADHQGSEDLSGRFQVAWSVQGLALAVRASDDQHRSGPLGTQMWMGDGLEIHSQMWMGDGLEIHFDRWLGDDYETTTVDGDDTQIGVSYGPGLDEVRGYRWYPYDRESYLTLTGVVLAQPTGYSLEILLPWSVFGVQAADLLPGMSFGFNISMSDNDGATPALQTVLSASPARTTHDSPGPSSEGATAQMRRGRKYGLAAVQIASSLDAPDISGAAEPAAGVNATNAPLLLRSRPSLDASSAALGPHRKASHGNRPSGLLLRCPVPKGAGGRPHLEGGAD